MERLREALFDGPAGEPVVYARGPRPAPDDPETMDKARDSATITGYVSQILLRSASREPFVAIGRIARRLAESDDGALPRVRISIKGGTNLLFMFLAMLRCAERARCPHITETASAIAGEVTGGVFGLSDLDTALLLPDDIGPESLARLQVIVVEELRDLNRRLGDTITENELGLLNEQDPTCGETYDFHVRADNLLIVGEPDAEDTVVEAGAGDTGGRYTSVNLSIERDAGFVLMRNMVRARKGGSLRSGEIIDVSYSTDRFPHRSEHLVPFSVVDHDGSPVCDVHSYGLRAMAEDLYRTVVDAAYTPSRKIEKRIKRAAIVASVLDSVIQREGSETSDRPVYVQRLLTLLSLADCNLNGATPLLGWLSANVFPYTPSLHAREDRDKDVLRHVRAHYKQAGSYKDAVRGGLSAGKEIAKCLAEANARQLLVSGGGLVLRLPPPDAVLTDPLAIDVAARTSGGAAGPAGAAGTLLGAAAVLLAGVLATLWGSLS